MRPATPVRALFRKGEYITKKKGKCRMKMKQWRRGGRRHQRVDITRRYCLLFLFSYFQHAVSSVSNLEILGIEQDRHAQISSMGNTSSMKRAEIISKYQKTKYRLVHLAFNARKIQCWYLIDQRSTMKFSAFPESQLLREIYIVD